MSRGICQASSYVRTDGRVFTTPLPTLIGEINQEVNPFRKEEFIVMLQKTSSNSQYEDSWAHNRCPHHTAAGGAVYLLVVECTIPDRGTNE